MWHAWWRGVVFTGFRLGGPKGRDHWEDIGVSGKINLDLKETYFDVGKLDSADSG